MNKPFRNLDEQVDLLKSRGLRVDSDQAAKVALHDHNYYRFSGYARQFQVAPKLGQNDFVPETTFDQVLKMMELDGALRALLFEALTIIEITVRSRYAHDAGRIFGDGAFYLDADMYLEITPELDRHISKIESELRRPKLVTVARYRDGDDLTKVPIWVAIELVTFGMLARMVQYLQDPEAAKNTAASLSVPWLGFQSTVHAFSVLRNLCAHHAQLWHRRLDISAPTLKKDKRRERSHSNGAVYADVIALKRYVLAVDRTSTWPNRIDALFARDPIYTAGILSPSSK